jgi:hypothetical protein
LALLPATLRNYDSRNIPPFRAGVRRFAHANHCDGSGRRSGGSMKIRLIVLASLRALFSGAALPAQQIGKYVPVPAGAEADHSMAEINQSAQLR